MKMHDLSGNLWLQNLALIPPVTTLTLIGLEMLVLKVFATQRTEPLVKVDIA